jgi:hypothetical protein
MRLPKTRQFYVRIVAHQGTTEELVLAHQHAKYLSCCLLFLKNE